MNSIPTPPVFITQQPISQIQLSPATEDNYTGNIQTSTNILSEQSSVITTNPFINDTEKQKEIQDLQDQINLIIKKDYNKNSINSIQNLSLLDINHNIGISCIELMNDLLNKPKHVPWTYYIQESFKKNQRYTYIGFLLIFISIFYLIIN